MNKSIENLELNLSTVSQGLVEVDKAFKRGAKKLEPVLLGAKVIGNLVYLPPISLDLTRLEVKESVARLFSQIKGFRRAPRVLKDKRAGLVPFVQQLRNQGVSWYDMYVEARRQYPRWNFRSYESLRRAYYRRLK